jgi:hypothetical protein
MQSVSYSCESCKKTSQDISKNIGWIFINQRCFLHKITENGKKSVDLNSKLDFCSVNCFLKFLLEKDFLTKNDFENKNLSIII